LICSLQVAAYEETPPIFKISAFTWYESGLQQGQSGGPRIRAWRNSSEMRGLSEFITGPGRTAFEQMKHDNQKAFPQYVEEMHGVADGCGLPMDDIWMLNLINELEALRDYMGGEAHCSDFYAVAPGGYQAGFSHGHNEDWPGEVRHEWYIVELTGYYPGGVENCSGLAYPGAMIGWCPTWNTHGIYLTQNSLFPKSPAPGGLGSAFTQRSAICGPSGSKGLDAVIAELTKGNWSSGASVNIVDLAGKRMANVEVFQDSNAVTIVTEEMGNYTHFNMYKALGVGQLDERGDSTMHRQARADALPPVRNTEDIKARLSDVEDQAYPIYRNSTLATFVLDGLTGQLDMWCCGDSALGASPRHSWNIAAKTQGEQVQLESIDGSTLSMLL